MSGGAVVCVAAVAALLLSGCGRRADARAGAGKGAAMAPDAAGPGATPESAAPVLRTLDVEGVRAELLRARGHVLFVHLWASWCGPCLEELPLVDRLARKARSRGAVFLSVSLDTDYRGIARLPALLRARAPSLTPIVAHFDDGARFTALFSKSWEGNIPALFVFDRAGKLQRSLFGESDPIELDALMTEMLGAPPVP